MPNIPGQGLVKGLGVTLRTMLKPAVTTQYPKEKETPTVRARGVIALMEPPLNSAGNKAHPFYARVSSARAAFRAAAAG